MLRRSYTVTSAELRDHVECWFFSATDLPQEEESAAGLLLSADERARAARFRVARDRRCYIAAHIALRVLIARYTGRPREALEIRAGLNGCPILHDSDLYFNISHSGDSVLLGFSRAAPVGVDVEEIREIPEFMALARSHFTSAEFDAITQFPPEQREKAFFTIWTRKEAFLKATGLALSLPLSGFGTGDPGRPPYVTSLSRGGVWADWTLVDFVPAEKTAGAVAIQRSNIEINFCQAKWSSLLGDCSAIAQKQL